MTYVVKELRYTLQGEGAQAGRPCVLLRFTGCNLWTGLEPHRSSAVCQFCDTDFRGTDGPGGSRYPTSEALAAAVARLTPSGNKRLVVCTGGEPTLQLDCALVDALHRHGFEVALETNGTKPVAVDVEWICVSPKAGAALRQRAGNELKVVFPQPTLDLEALLQLDFEHFFLQPMDGSELVSNTELAVAHCLADPRWRLSVQTHKILKIP